MRQSSINDQVSHQFKDILAQLTKERERESQSLLHFVGVFFVCWRWSTGGHEGMSNARRNRGKGDARQSLLDEDDDTKKINIKAGMGKDVINVEGERDNGNTIRLRDKCSLSLCPCHQIDAFEHTDD